MKRRSAMGRTGGAGGVERPHGGPARDPMDALRARIDDLDRRLVALLNERAGCAIALGRIKKERALPIYQPAREEEVLRNVQGTNGGPLESEALRRLFERIIDESRRIERVATERAGPAAGGPSAELAGPGETGD